MMAKFFGRRSEFENQCVVPRTENQKSLSSFVDKMIGDFPERSECCSSNIMLNLYAEETNQNGETLKVFKADHHFKNGNLVYSATQEMVPDRSRQFKRSSRWNMNEKKVLSPGTGTRLEHSKTPSSVNLSNEKDENRERYLHTLASQNIHRQTSSPFIRKLPPRSFKYRASFQEPRKLRYPEKSQLVKTSSKVSICSEDSYSSPKGHEVKISHREENHTKTAYEPLPPPRFRRDLFVIPKHTCRSKIPTQVVNYMTQKSPSLNTVRRVPRVDSPAGSGYMLRSEISHIASPREKNVKFSPQRRVRYVDDSTNVRKQKHHRVRKEDSAYSRIGQPYYQVHTTHETHGDKNKDRIKHGLHEHPVNEPFVQKTKVQETIVTESDDIYESAESTRTLPFTPATSDTEDEGEFQTCTHKHRETSVKRSKNSKISSGQGEKKHEHIGERKVRRRRQIYPNKVVHFEDTGKRHSKHYFDEKVTIDGDRGFGDGKSLYFKDNYGKYSPKKSSSSKAQRNNSKAYEVTFRESLEDHLKQLEDISNRKKIVRNIVNNEALVEYREKYTKCMPHKKTEGENFEWKSTVKKEYSTKTYVPKHCEACDIERFWAD